MNNHIYKFLNNYSSTPLEIDKLFVSAFLKLNDIKVEKNIFIKKLIINKNEVKAKGLDEFIDILRLEISDFNIEVLIELFEFVISPSDRVINGAIYTPKYIREYITNQVFKYSVKNIISPKIADISCGCGGFLLTAAKKLKRKTKRPYKYIFKNNIYGLDIQAYSTKRTKILLSLLALTEKEDENFKFNLFTNDALSFNWKDQLKDFNGFDIILGNPPYVRGRNLPKETLKKLKQFDVCNSGNPDLYIAFFQIGLDNLKENGVLGFITMNTFFKSLNGRNLRAYFKNLSLNFKIIDFGTEQVFKSKNTYTCICLFEKKQKKQIKYSKSTCKDLPVKERDFKKIEYSKLNSITGWNLNNFHKISKIESTGIPFGEVFKTRHGIATLSNKTYIFKPVKEDDDYYYLQNDKLFQIEKSVCRDIINPNKLRKNKNIDSIKEKIIFPYTNDKKPLLLEESFLRNNFPKAYKYLKYKKKDLSKRDKGEGKYENWYAFGRTQSLSKVKTKLFFPKISDRTPSVKMESDENLLYYNGQAVIGHTENEMLFAKKIMESRIFWYYIKSSSKPYSSNYYSLNGNYIKNFGICSLNQKEMNFVLNEDNKKELDAFFEDKYGISIQ